MKEYSKMKREFDEGLISFEDFKQIYEEDNEFKPNICVNYPETNQSTLALIAEGSQYIMQSIK